MKRGLSQPAAGLLLLGVQLALVLSIAGKYVYERKTRPRVWVRAAQYDPETMLRGRYLSLLPVVDACALPRDEEHYKSYELGARTHRSGTWSWAVTLVAEKGRLVPKEQMGASREGTSTVRLGNGDDCRRTRVTDQLLLFIPEHARTPLPLAAGQELWVEVTVPATGPPRPVQLATSGPDGFRLLRF